MNPLVSSVSFVQQYQCVVELSFELLGFTVSVIISKNNGNQKSPKIDLLILQHVQLLVDTLQLMLGLVKLSIQLTNFAVSISDDALENCDLRVQVFHILLIQRRLQFERLELYGVVVSGTFLTGVFLERTRVE